ncbi:hypothetical protein POL68_03745 [Stigmatella sp. ncwal1]|uniref:DUF1700 domain-containing protein n=1 Tax=Stigmatella ashevillensis TaxID=2995309 RepID=A0ABT5D3E7_9BACT|nr:hypothetical protein [Stigmatella ashevillena]MDC0707574.1 hypothetical protein [Stigmatella ashevillena]
MERLRSAPHPATHALEEKAAPMALSALLEQVSSLAGGRQEVDALMEGLTRPLAADESPRERADFLLSLLNSHHLRSMLSSQGGTVEAAAVRALMELGHPYALEIPPEAMDSLHEDSLTRELGPRHFPLLGIVLVLLGTAPAVMTGPVGFLLALPSLAALIGGALELRVLQKVGGVLLGLMGVGLLVSGGVFIHQDLRSSHENFHGLGIALGMAMAVPGLLLTVGSFLLRHPAWRIQDKAPKSAQRPKPRTHE